MTLKAFAYQLKISFPEALHETLQSYLYELDFSTFEEGEMGKDDEGNIIILNENTLIKISSAALTPLEILSKDLKTLSTDIHTEIYPLTTDFNNAWKEFSKPIVVSDNILIQPSWIPLKESYPVTIHLDPGLAFGSGGHETTLLCMRAIEKVVKEKQITSMLDVGCGSGVLSILGRKLGVRKVVGIDVDELAIVSSKENASQNELDDIDFSTTPLSSVTETYDLIVANIISSVLDSLMDDIKKKLNPNGTLILSGLLGSELREFKERHDLQNFKEEVLGEWGVLFLSP